MENYSKIDLLRFNNFANENKHLKPFELLKEYDKKVPRLTESEKLNNLKKALNLNFDKMKRHELKITKTFFDQILSGEKKAELRKNDRNYQKGDIILFREFDLNADNYTGKKAYFKITCITEYPLGLKNGYVMLSIEQQKEHITKKLDLIIGNKYTLKKQITTFGKDIFEKGCKLNYLGIDKGVLFLLCHYFLNEETGKCLTVPIVCVDEYIE